VSKAKRLNPQDMLFLYGETPSTMMHVGALMPFTAPPDSPADFLRKLVDDSKKQEVVAPWNLKLSQPWLLYSPTQSWVVDKKFDLDYHVRRSALASPGDERELGILVSRLHSHALDLSRPPWELHFIEGLEGGRFAIYVKIHHSLVDGYTAGKMLSRSMSTDPTDMNHPLFFNVKVPSKKRKAPDETGGGFAGNLMAGLGSVVNGVGELFNTVTDAATSTVDLTRALIHTEVRNDNEYKNLTNSFAAPHSILNNRIGRNRRFATQQYELDRLRRIGKKYDSTVNDVALAIVGGGLRKFLGELDELPEPSLVTFLPVNVRSKDDEGGGNAVGTILAPMGTDIVDPVERLEAITTATKLAKAELKTMGKNTALAYSAALMAPSTVQMASAISGVKPPWPYTFNLCVSNVPGPKEVLYLRGSRMEASYPVSIPVHGQALNITLHSYADTLNFGFVGCRDTVPHLQRLALYTGEELDALEKAAGTAE